MNPDPVIRRAESLADYRACQDAQRQAWGITEENYVVPVATLVGAQLHGGLVLGAFLPTGEAVGMSFAFLGRIEGRVGLYSQLTGIVPGYQDRGIGYRLKTAQRSIARREGLPCIAWAFDALQAGNARFNLDKLGATAGRFVVDMYGPRTDALNRDTPTDRLVVVWETLGEPTPERPDAEALVRLPRLIALVEGPSPGAPAEPTYAGLPESAPGLLLEVPPDVNALRARDPGLAGRWGTAVRRAFLAAFAAGYRAVGFAADGGRRYYVLRPAASSAPNGSADQRA